MMLKKHLENKLLDDESSYKLTKILNEQIDVLETGNVDIETARQTLYLTIGLAESYRSMKPAEQERYKLEVDRILKKTFN